MTPKRFTSIVSVGASTLLVAGLAGPAALSAQASDSTTIAPAATGSSAWAVIGLIESTYLAGSAIDIDDDTVYFSDEEGATSIIGAISAGTTAGTFDETVSMPQPVTFLAVDSDDDTIYATAFGNVTFVTDNGVLYEINGQTMSLDDSTLPYGAEFIGISRYLTQPAVNSEDDSVYLGSNGVSPDVLVKGPSGWQSITTAVGDSANNFAVNQSDDTVYASWFFDSKVTAFSGRSLSPTFSDSSVTYPYGLAVNSVDDTVYAVGPAAPYTGPSVVYEYTGTDFTQARSVSLPSLGNQPVRFLSLSSDGALLLASEWFPGSQVYLINPLTMTVDDTVFTGPSSDAGSAAQITSSGLIYAPTNNGIKTVAQVGGPDGTWTGSSGEVVTTSLTPTPSVVNGRTITLDDSTVTSVSFGDDTTTFTTSGNDLSITVPPGTGTVPVTAQLNGGNFISLGTFTYTAAPTPTPANPPSAPLDVTAMAGDGSAAITWQPPVSPGSFPVTTYQAISSPGGKTCLVSAPTTTCTIEGLANGTTYTFTARALNGGGWSPASAPSNSVTPSAPVTPTILITGYRGTGDSGGRVFADGVTTNLAGQIVQARVHLAGEIDYYDGSKRRVSENEGFTWQRRSKKKVYVYFTTEDRSVRSNRIIIPS